MNNELQQIVAIIQQQTDGVSISGLLKQLPYALPRRTLLRRLSTLKQMGAIESRGEKSATRYYLKEAVVRLPLSPKARSLKQHVHQAIQQRDPVAYHKKFLYDYKPNQTYYLTKTERDHLQQQGQPFDHALESGTYVKRILHRLLIDLSWNSSRLEGNTYSLLETERLIAFGAQAHDKSAFEAQMIINHKAAIEFMMECAHDLGVSRYVVLNIHGLLSNNLLANPAARGQLRQIPVGIGRTVYHPLEIPQVISECFDHIVATAAHIKDPFEQAFFLMVQLPYLQPFEDVNKRVSRLSANISLIKHNLSPLSFIDVPEEDYISGLLAIYELNAIDLMRDVFIWAYERSAKQYRVTRDVLGEPDLFYMQFSEPLSVIVHLVIEKNLQGNAILTTLEKWAHNNIESPYPGKFIRLAEKEIASLHEGNIAIYNISLEQFSRWKKSK